MTKLFEFDVHIGDWRVLVQNRDIGRGAIGSKHIADDAVTNDKIAPGAVGHEQLAPEAVEDLSRLEGELQGLIDDAGRAEVSANEAAQSANEAAQGANDAGDYARDKGQVASEAAQDAQQAAELARQKAQLAQDKAQLADQKATEASRVNATLSGTFLTVTDREGQSETANTKGDPGTTDYEQLVHKPDLTVYVTDAVYDNENHLLKFKNSAGTVIATVDAAPFIKDAVVDSVAIQNGNLVITFNTDAGKQPISIPLTDIFDPANYYTKTETDTILSDMADFVVENEDEQGLVNEVDRVLLLLYQALTDAGAVITPAQSAAALAQAKAQMAEQAAVAANNAANNANTKAGYAQDQGDYAKAQGEAATAAVDAAKGDFPTLDDRLDHIEENAGTVDFVEDDTDTFPWRQ